MDGLAFELSWCLLLDVARGEPPGPLAVSGWSLGVVLGEHSPLRLDPNHLQWAPQPGRGRNPGQESGSQREGAFPARRTPTPPFP